MTRLQHIVAFGGGVDSTAMVLGMFERSMPIDLVLFADTGGERPETYAHIDAFSAWLVAHNLPSITIVKRVRKDGSLETLEEECHRRKNLPSIAYGFKSCSQKHKIAPQDKFLNSWQPAIDWWETGAKCIKYIGYDAGEAHRAANAAKREDNKYDYRYPLIDWSYEREDCLLIIAKHGIKNVSKSACFFCPSSKQKEIIDLYEKHPDLIDRAIAIEKQAELTTIKGLGRNYAWETIIKAHKAQDTFPFYVGFDTPCGCTE